MEAYSKLCDKCSTLFFEFNSEDREAMAHANCRYVEMKLAGEIAGRMIELKANLTYGKTVNDEL